MTMNFLATQHRENEESFETFFQGWLTRQADFLQQLFAIQTQLMSNEGNVNEEINVRANQLITRVMTHYNQYYEAKSRVTHRNSFLVFSPPWLTPYERMFLWIAGFKPSIIFPIIRNSGVEFSPEQASRIEVVAAETGSEEQQLAEELIRAEQELSAPTTMALVRMAGREVNGAIQDDVEAELDRLTLIMEALVTRADYLREKTVLKVMEILNTCQTVRFLAGVAHFQLSIRHWGTHREMHAPAVS